MKRIDERGRIPKVADSHSVVDQSESFSRMQRRDRHRNADEWISLVACRVQQSPKEVDVKRESFYDEYPYPCIYPDMLPPDYPAILSLFMNVIAIVWNVII